MYQNDAMKVLTGEVRLSYANLTTPRAAQQGGEPKYSVTLLIPKSDAATKADIDAAIQAAANEAMAKVWNGARPPMLKVPIYDGDGVRPSGVPFGDECKGHWVMTASTKNKPQVVGIDNINCELSPADIYSGMYGAIKVRSYEGAEGGVDTLEISVNAENYKTLLALLKDAIIENARGYDAKDDRMSGDPNQMNIQSMYSDIDLDANGIEMEFQASMEELLWFINKHLANTGGRSFEGEDVTVIFDRDVLINETEAINNCKNSVGILSDETIVKMHPWVTDPEQELQRIKDEKEEAMQADPYQAAFLANRNQPPVNNEGGGDGKTD